jgi:hypothetical protein
MCRNIKTLYNFEPPVSEEEIQAAAIQFVRKISGFKKPSLVNTHAFEIAVTEISSSIQKLLDSLETSAKQKNREAEAEKSRVRNKHRFGNNTKLRK